MFRKVALTVIGLLVFLPLKSFGLGVGSIEMESHLNQPLRAKIPLIQIRDLTLVEILPSLASKAAFDAAGVQRSYFVTQLRFEVKQDETGAAYILVKSRQPSREPFLNFLMEVHWPSGRILREFTILLDPPEFKEELPLAVIAPVRGPSSPEKVKPPKKIQDQSTMVKQAEVAPLKNKPNAPNQSDKSFTKSKPKAKIKSVAAKPIPMVGDDVKTSQKKVVRAGPSANVEKKNANIVSRNVPSPVAASSFGGSQPDTYKIQENDTLWKISDRANESYGATVQQTMIAIQRKNPDAFINNNVNLIKAGQVIRVPTAEEVSSISRNAALEEFARQNNAWEARLAARKNQKLAEKPLTDVIDGSGRGLNTDREKPLANDKLTIVTPTRNTTDSGSATGQEGSEGQGEGNLLNVTDQSVSDVEEVEKEKRIIEELNLELLDLQQQTDTSNQIIELKNDQLLELVKKLEALEKEKTLAMAAENIEEANIDDAVGVDGFDAEKIDISSNDASVSDIDSGIDSGIENNAGDNASQENIPAKNDLVGLDPAMMNLEPTEEPEEVSGDGIVESPFNNLSDEEPQPTELGLVEDPVSAKSNSMALLSSPMVVGSIVGILLLVLGTIVWVIKKRREEDEDDYEEDEDDYEEDEGEEEDNFDEDEGDDEIAVDFLEDGPGEGVGSEQLEAAMSVPADLSDKGAVDPEDVISEADIYLAYGKFPKAIEVLDSAIEKLSSNAPLRLKMLEVLVETKDNVAFNKHYQALHKFGELEVIVRASELASQIGATSNFEEEATQAVVSSADVSSADNAEGEEDPLDLDSAFEGLTDDTLDDVSSDLDALSDINSAPSEAEVEEEFELDFDESELSSDLETEPVKTDSSEHSSVDAEEPLSSNGPEGFELSDLDESEDEFELELELEGSNLEELSESLDDVDLDEADSSAAKLDSNEETEILAISQDEIEISLDLEEDLSLDADLEIGDEEDLSLMDDADETSTKLDLARAYIDMGDSDGAKDILDEILLEGDDVQQQEAKDLLDKVGGMH